MIEITFSPTPEFATKLHLLTQEQKSTFGGILFNVIAEAFNLTPTGYSITINAKDDFALVAKGIAPFSAASSDFYTQQIANKLTNQGLRQILFISSIASRAEPQDRLLAPDVLATYNVPEIMQRLFKIPDSALPDDFRCPITKTIIGDPAYLTSNIMVNYEYVALARWVKEQRTDPTTRASISAPGIVKNDILRRRIASYCIAHVLGLDPEPFSQPTKEAAVSTEGIIATTTTLAPLTFFAPKQDAAATGDPLPTSATTPTSSSMYANYEACKLGEEFCVLTAKAVRRAASENKNKIIVNLLQGLPSEIATKIVNLQDENLASQKTALHHAVKNGHKEAQELLQQYGAKNDIKDAQGQTAHDLLTSTTVVPAI